MDMNEINGILLKGTLKAWLRSEMDKGSDPQDVAEAMINGLVRYVGKCPVKLLIFLDALGEVTQELSAEELGLAVPNVKPEGAVAVAPRFNSDNYD